MKVVAIIRYPTSTGAVFKPIIVEDSGGCVEVVKIGGDFILNEMDAIAAGYAMLEGL